MFRDLVTKYRLDCLFIALATALAFSASVFQHAAMKPITRAVAFAGPVIFTVSLLLLISIMGLAGRHTWARRARRGLIGVAVGSVFVFAAMFKAESFYAPIAWKQGATPAEVVVKIASNDDVERFVAWSRLSTFTPEEKDQVARELGFLLLSANADARSSATLTLEHVLRRHTMATLAVLRPDLEAYVKLTGSRQALPERTARAGEFAQGFVARNYRSILKALEPKNRGKLPAGGMEALFLALATEEPTGQLILRGIAEQGDDTLKPLAQGTINLAAAPI